MTLVQTGRDTVGGDGNIYQKPLPFITKVFSNSFQNFYSGHISHPPFATAA